MNWRAALAGVLAVGAVTTLGLAVVGSSATPVPAGSPSATTPTDAASAAPPAATSVMAKAPVAPTSTKAAAATAKPPTSAPATTMSSAASPTAKTMVNVAPVVTPVAVHIPTINVNSSLIPLFLNPDGTVQVPPVSTPQQAGYYAFDAMPGQVGAAVLLGHVDGTGKLGVFHDIGKLNIGDQIVVDRADGSTIKFSVTKVETVNKSAFPTGAVYGPTSDPELRLVSCGGPFLANLHSYADNVIVMAKLAS